MGSWARRAGVLAAGTWFGVLLAAGTGWAQTPTPRKDCSDFSTQAQAQEFFTQNGGPQNDPFNLDVDNDGQACEGLPGGTSSPSATTTPGPTTGQTSPLTPSKSNYNAGEAGTATASNLTPSEDYNLEGEQSPGVKLATAKADAQGAASFSFTIPTSFHSGPATLIALPVDGSGQEARASITIGQALPVNGAPTAAIALSGLTFLEAGYGMTLAARRIGVRRRALPLYLMRTLIKAAREGQNEVALTEDVYLVRRTHPTEEAPPAPQAAPARSTFMGVYLDGAVTITTPALPTKPAVMSIAPAPVTHEPIEQPVAPSPAEQPVAPATAGRVDWPFFTPSDLN